MRLFSLTLFALLAFAGNSILNRLALTQGAIDPAGFVFFRVLCAALVLFILLYLKMRTIPSVPATWWGPLGLLVYMLGFSFAYLHIDAGFGALLLFGIVQLGMFGYATITAQFPTKTELIGALIALIGLSYLLLGDAINVHWGAVFAMIAAALGWVAFSIAGQTQSDPLVSSSSSFVILLPVVALVYVLFGGGVISPYGTFLAAISGAITSGLGYYAWYAVLPHLPSTVVGVLQLLVPLLAIVLGIFILGESLSYAIIFGGIGVLVGVLISLWRRRTL